MDHLEDSMTKLTKKRIEATQINGFSGKKVKRYNLKYEKLVADNI